MSITSQSLFSDMMSKSKRLDDRQKRLRLREKRLIQSAEKRRVTISDFFGESGQSQEPMMPKGFMGGDPLKIIKEFTGKNVSTREEGGPIEEGKPYLVGEKGPELIVPSESGNVIPNDEISPYFEASIGREDARNLKSNIITESFFDTGKGRTSDLYEEKTSDGTTLFRDKTELIGSSMTQSYYQHTPTITETDKDGGVETFTETETLSTKISSIAKDDLIEHQDQLLGEIHKIKGFENVTINDVIRGTTGLPKDTMFNILSNSDASFATAARTEEQNRMPTDYLVNASSNFKSEAETRYNSEGIQPNEKENFDYSSLASSINQSVGVTKTLIQPIVEKQIQTVQSPVSVPTPSKPKIIKVSKSNLPPSVASLLK